MNIHAKKKEGGGRTGSVRARVGSLSVVEQVVRGHRAVTISLLKYNHRAPNSQLYRSPRFDQFFQKSALSKKKKKNILLTKLSNDSFISFRGEEIEKEREKKR